MVGIGELQDEVAEIKSNEGQCNVEEVMLLPLSWNYPNLLHADCFLY